MQVDAITTEDELRALRPEWAGLAASSGLLNPFVLPDLATSWWQAFCGRHCELLVCVARSNSGALTGILPLYRKKGSGWLQPLMAPGYAESWNLIIRPGHLENVTMDFLEWLQGQPNWHGLRLHNVPEDSLAIHALRSAALALGMRTLVQPAGPCMITSFNGTSSVNSLLEENPAYPGLVRISERLHAAHKVKYGLTRLTPGALRQIAGMERAPGRANKSGFFCTTRALDFMRRFSLTRDSAGMGRVFTMHIDGRLAAYVVGFETAEEIQLYFSGMDDLYAGFKPIFLLFRLIMQYSIKKGLKNCNFLVGGKEYSTHWKADARQQATTFIFRNSLPGRMSYFMNAHALPFFVHPQKHA